MKNLFVRFIREEKGQDLVEYAFLIVFIALAVTAGLTTLAGDINTEMGTIGTKVTSGS